MLAILQMSDTPQIESTAQMLRHAGYDEIMVCGPQLREELTNIGCDTIIAVSRMLDIGYQPHDKTIKEARIQDVERCELFVEIKVRNVEPITVRWPRLNGRVLWWRVNGAQPEICPKGGDEVNLICPIATACLWYGHPMYLQVPGEACERSKVQNLSDQEHTKDQHVNEEDLRQISSECKTGINGMAYTFWPPYPKHGPFDEIDRRLTVRTDYTPSFCVCHNVSAWGYGDLITDLETHYNVKFYGNGSPAGVIENQHMPYLCSTALALLHMKSVDCPGWALYEALLGGCPVVTGRLLNSRMLAYELLEDGVTCLEFGVPASLEYGRGPTNITKCIEDIQDALAILSNPETNLRIGQVGRQRLNELMWNEERDGESFKTFIDTHFH